MVAQNLGFLNHCVSLSVQVLVTTHLLQVQSLKAKKIVIGFWFVLVIKFKLVLLKGDSYIFAFII